MYLFGCVFNWMVPKISLENKIHVNTYTGYWHNELLVLTSSEFLTVLPVPDFYWPVKPLNSNVDQLKNQLRIKKS